MDYLPTCGKLIHPLVELVTGVVIFSSARNRLRLDETESNAKIHLNEQRRRLKLQTFHEQSHHYQALPVQTVLPTMRRFIVYQV